MFRAPFKATLIGLALAFGASAFSTCASAAAPGNLDELLQQTLNSRDQEASLNAERESRFAAARDKQAALLAEAKAELAAERKRGAALTGGFDANEKRLGELTAELEARAGNLGEMFGVVRQVANDFSSVVRTSIISAQFPKRQDFVTELAQSKALPSIEVLERFWFEMQREMTESGKVVRYQTKVVMPDGKPVPASVVRVGPFTASTGGKYLSYLSTQGQLAVMARQPTSKFTDAAEEVEEAKSGFVRAMVDPTRGVLLSIYSQRPNIKERIDRGEAVGYIIILVGLIGAGLAIYQFTYLMMVRARVKLQLASIESPKTDNPLGRVLATFQGSAAKLEEDAEIVELRISEAVLKEAPKLERFQSFLRLAVAAGPLLGLIGTVVGMIVTFQSITESGSSDPKLMAAGISQAMIATVLGLGIAIPLLFANAWLTSISKSILQILDEQSTGLLAGRLEAARHG
ncbi:biopolymer transport protein ExbB [Solimonas aquatica]|uniref:Biopolymer transport protein ExbB n=1 Tax=Solimonas aquatica TaxID=489703 RepID=A0A1H8ZTQ7_9GAMM|nr:MotA/TolQ/ExbB proton channel family protein [Solimonas aquatica]SEP67647.1 biopolymer transport protein ExbB [Solimonas aquatica]